MPMCALIEPFSTIAASGLNSGSSACSAKYGALTLTAKLSSQLLRLYGLDVFSPIHYDFVREDGKGVLKIETPPKPYGRNSLQFGFNIQDDFRGDSGFT